MTDPIPTDDSQSSVKEEIYALLRDNSRPLAEIASEAKLSLEETERILQEINQSDPSIQERPWTWR